MTDLSVSFQAARPLWLALLPLAVLIIAWWTYRRTYPPVNRWYRWLLVILRLAVVALVGLLLFDPALTLKTERSRPERVAVLVDRSASMLLPATREGTGVDSLDRGKAALRFIKSTIERQGGSSRISYFTFGEELTALDSLDPDKILSQVEDRTDLASALKTLLPGSSSRWDRIVVVSDGQVNSGADPAAALAAARAAAPGGSGPVVDAVVVGEPPGLPEELALESVERLGGRVFAGGEIELEVSLAVGRPPMQGTSGAVPSLAVVEVHVNGRLAAQKRIRIGSVEEAWFISSRIKLPAGDPGQKVLRVLVRPLENEWTALNNERLLFVEVASGKRRVLLISNRPDWDFSFLRRALMSNEDWAVESRVVLSPPGDRSLVRGVDPRGRYSAGRLPSRSELDDMELVLLHGELSGFERAFLARVAARVSKGGLGIIFWPIGKISPASLPAVLKGCLPFRGGLPASFLQAPGGQQPSVVFTLGRYNVLAGLGAGAPLENLSPLQWVFPAVPLGKGAEVLARAGASGTGDKAGVPVLVVQPAGKVRVASVLGRGLWRWHMLEQSPEGEEENHYYRLWDELAQWLLSGEKSSDFILLPQQQVFSLGEKVRFGGSLRQPDSGKDTDSVRTVRVVVLAGSEGKDTVRVAEARLAPVKGRGFSISLDLGRLSPGLYRYEGFSSTGERVSGKFAVEKYSSEFSVLEPDTTVLSALSGRTGGRFFTAGASAEETSISEVVETELRYFRPATSEWVYLLLVLLLGAEWTLRRRKSLA